MPLNGKSCLFPVGYRGELHFRGPADSSRTAFFALGITKGIFGATMEWATAARPTSISGPLAPLTLATETTYACVRYATVGTHKDAIIQ